MRKADIAGRVDDTIQRHPSQLEKIDLLPVDPCHGMVRVRQAEKWDPLLGPIVLEGFRQIGTDCQDLRPATLELVRFVPQARQLRAAVRSPKAAQKGKHDYLAAKV